jgi:SAM-dependent methyltransferase
VKPENDLTAPADLDLAAALAQYWDADASTYDHSTTHRIHTAAQQAAWNAVLLAHLPPPPAHVLDVGTGTGFLALLLARLGYKVTAQDISPRMLEQLRAYSTEESLDITLVESEANDPPPGPFDVVTERLLMWTLPNPVSALQAWRRVAPGGRLLCFGGVWGAGDRAQALLDRGKDYLHRLLRRHNHHHHAPYGKDLHQSLPMANGISPSLAVELASAAGWTDVRLERLRDVEWANALTMALPERLLGATPEYLMTARAP